MLGNRVRWANLSPLGSASSQSASSSSSVNPSVDYNYAMWKEKTSTASWIDAGLSGVNGAMRVLENLTPNMTELVLSHNSLGDKGVQALCAGLLQLRRDRGFPGLLELNLTSNNISDQGFYYVVQYLLLSSAPPKSMSPTLTKLYLSNNNITLSPSSPLPSLLSAALSHPNSQLYFLSLISNEGLHLDFLRLCTPATLRVLQIDTCALSDYRSLLGFLSRKDGGGRLEQLRANGNYFGTRGVRRLAKLVADGRNTSLLRFELSANSVANSRVASQDNLPAMTSIDHGNNHQQRQQDDSSSEDDGENPLELDNGVDVSSVFMIPGLAKALGRNAVLREMTQLSALKMLPYARLLLNAQPPPEPSDQQLMDSIYNTSSSSSTSGDTVTMSTEQLKDMAITSHSSPTESFPWLKLPMEIRLAVLSHLGRLLDADRACKMADVIQTRLPAQYRTRRILSASQWQHLLAFAGSKETLLRHLRQQETLRAVQCEQWEAHA